MFVPHICPSGHTQQTHLFVKNLYQESSGFSRNLAALHKPKVTFGTIKFVSLIHSLFPPCLCVCSRLADSSRFEREENHAIILLCPHPLRNSSSLELTGGRKPQCITITNISDLITFTQAVAACEV
jgi:hypothetical protein